MTKNEILQHIITNLEKLYISETISIKDKECINECLSNTKTLMDNSINVSNFSGSLYEELYKENRELKETASKRSKWFSLAKKEAGYDDSVSFDIVWNETLKKAQITVLPEYEILKRDILRDIDIGKYSDYLKVRKMVAELSGLPVMAMTFDGHCAVIKSKLDTLIDKK